jgi:methyltransferase (TIGR00027 family)
MEADKHSLTAVMMAALRAYHHSCSEPRIFDDPLAQKMLSPAEREAFEKTSVQFLEILNPVLAASCTGSAQSLHHALRAGPGVGPLVRARFTEEALLAAVADGIRQYVIVGAGLDTFAFRRSDLMQRLRVVEIDHPASQAFKRDRLRQAGLIPPADLHFAAADLERESVSNALCRTPYDRAQPAFFAWPGVTMYLTQAAIFKTLRSIAEVAAPGSRIAFDYIEPGAYGPDAPPRLSFLIQHARQVGEPMMPNLTPANLKSDLAAIGFQLVENLTPSDIQSRYLTNTEGFHALEFWHLAQALRISEK